MSTFEGTTFENQRVDLDDNKFVGCDFRRCDLVYSGGRPPVLIQNNIAHCQFKWEGAAQRTLAFLNALYKADKGVVEDIISSIRLD